MIPNIHVATSAGLYSVAGSGALELEHPDIADLAFDGSQWWAVGKSGSVLSRDRDTEWRQVAWIDDRSLNCILPTPAGVFVGTDRAHLLRVTEAGAEQIEGFESAPERDEWFTPWGGPPDVRSLAVGGDALFVNVHVGGILRSDDGGSAWSPTIDIRSDVHEVIVADPRSPDVVLAAAAVGCAISRDGGASWDFDDAGLEASYARAIAVAGDSVLLTASLGPRGGRAAIYRRALDAPGTFEKIHNGLPEWFEENIDTGCVDGRDGVVAFGTSDGRLFASEDGGDTWGLLADGLASVRRVRLDP